jgi:uncharacterized protein (TIGR00369 family)
MGTTHEDVELLALVRTIFEEKIPFNKYLGLRVESLDADNACLKLAMSDELVGNYFRGSLHGGVVSAALDVTGGLLAFLRIIEDMKGKPQREKLERFSRMGTIDLRVDFLRPGVGKYFLASGFILRMGNRVAVTRMEFHNDEKCLIAVGTGAYLVA